jgi:hypothetical protein
MYAEVKDEIIISNTNNQKSAVPETISEETITFSNLF